MISFDYRKFKLVSSGVIYLPAHNNHRQLCGRLKMIRRAKKWDREQVSRDIKKELTDES